MKTKEQIEANRIIGLFLPIVNDDGPMAIRCAMMHVKELIKETGKKEYYRITAELLMINKHDNCHPALDD